MDDGYWFPEVATEVLRLPGVDPRGTFRADLGNTAAAIIADRTPDGYYRPDWNGPELDPLDGTRTWAEASRMANGGRGGGQATPPQIMASASSALVVQAAHLLGRGTATVGIAPQRTSTAAIRSPRQRG